MRKRRKSGAGPPMGNKNAKKREEEKVKNRVKVKYLFGQRYLAEFQEDLLDRLQKSKWPSQRKFLDMCYREHLFKENAESDKHL